MATRSYVVCSTPRSGSTMLCELLSSTGVAGRPEEYFEACADTGVPPHPGDFLEGLPRTGAGIRDDGTPASAPAYSDLRGIGDYREHLSRSFRLGTTPNGVFGTKLMWSQIEDLQRLTAPLTEYAGLSAHALIERLFDGPAYIWIRRRDTVRQAISLWRALQTRTWRASHRADDSSPPELHYSFSGIEHLVEVLDADDSAWGSHFEAHGIAPLTIGYEDDLERQPRGAVEAVLRHLGLKPRPGWAPRARTGRQADGLNSEWLAAYHRDAAAAQPSV